MILGHDGVTAGAARLDIGAASGDNSVTATYYFPDLSVYESGAGRVFGIVSMG
jgi:hypothetical protein